MLDIIQEINPDKEQTLIKICSGPFNEQAKFALRDRGYRVTIDAIVDPLESWSDAQYHAYHEDTTGYDLYYDVKKIPESERGKKFWMFIKIARRL